MRQFFHPANCIAGATISAYRRAEFKIQLAIPPAYVPAEWSKV